MSNSFASWLEGVRVLLVDDTSNGQVSARHRWLTNAGAAVTACPGTEAAHRLLEHEADRFDVVVAAMSDDSSLPAWCEFQLTHGTCGLVCVGQADMGLLRKVHQAGAMFVSREAGVADLMFAVFRASRMPIPDLRILAARARRLWDLPPQLTRILYYDLWGYSNQEIADALRLSLHTVHEYQSELRRRCGARTKSDYLRVLQAKDGRGPEQHWPR